MFNSPFFKEFVVKTPVDPSKIIEFLLEENIFAGIDLSGFDCDIDNGLLICVTEKRTKAEMDKFVELLGGVS